LTDPRPALRILGTRGVPATYGGFETSAEQIARHMTARGWRVTVYCQAACGGTITEDRWEGIGRVHIPERHSGPLGAVLFDLESTLHAVRYRELLLTLGYNTAVFFSIYRVAGRTNVVNMDGLEWMRSKWSRPVRWWLRGNEQIACRLSNLMIADHPELARYLGQYARASKITTLTYSAPQVEGAPVEPLAAWNLQPGGYALMVARPDPDNSPLEIIRTYSRHTRGMPLVVLGRYEPEVHAYHAEVMRRAGSEIHFLGALHDQAIMRSLRVHAAYYVHGHQRGGVNPSLVESMAAGTPNLAFGNAFNRWTAGPAAIYFDNEEELEAGIARLAEDESLRAELSTAGRRRHAEEFTEDIVLGGYERMLTEVWNLRLARRAAPIP
jgi:glycosyltransferase involved in cell wall biosynthesis